jgi:hypothetical protein
MNPRPTYKYDRGPTGAAIIREASTATRRVALSERSLPRSAQKVSATAEAGSKKGRFYRPLPKEFRRDGFSYRQITREGDRAIYEQKWTGRADSSPCYEVVRIRLRDGFGIGGRFVEAAEIYPKSEAWGVDGFTFSDKDAAFAKLRELA